jgi:predicted nucleotidyltransferase
VTKNTILTFLQEHKNELREHYGVTLLGLFGSYARGDAREDSDIDLVVELEQPDMFHLIGIKQTIEEGLHAKVDIVRLRKSLNL